MGKGLTEAFNKFRRHHGWEAVFQNDRHPEMQERQQFGDAWWIREVTTEGFVIVTCDLAIVANEDERQAVVDAGARIVGYASAQYNRRDMMRGLCRHWLSIQRHVATHPTVLKVWSGSKAPERLI